jgi:hypothetical protein
LAAYVELTIEQGADFTTTVTVKDETGNPSNLNNHSVAAQLRKSHYSSSATNFTATITDPGAGTITLTMASSVTANIAPSRYVYDLLLTNNSTNVKTRVIEGIANVLPSVTR